MYRDLLFRSFGAKFLSNKLGFVYNNEMDDFSAPNVTNEFGLPPSPVNFIKPGKRPQSSAVPEIILDKKGNVLMTIGAAGGTIITTSVAQVSLLYLTISRLRRREYRRIVTETKSR